MSNTQQGNHPVGNPENVQLLTTHHQELLHDLHRVVVRAVVNSPENPSSGKASKPVDGSQQEASNSAIARIDHAECHERSEPVEGDSHEKS